MRPRLSPVTATLVCAAAFAVPASASAAASPASPTVKASASAAAKAKKKKTTAQRVTALSRSLNRAKAQQRLAQKQLDALVKQNTVVNGQISEATTKLSDSIKLSSPAGLLAVLQEPSSGIPALFDKLAAEATANVRQILGSAEYAVAVVTVGDFIASPTLLVSADIPDIGTPVTFSGKLPVVVPPGTNAETVDVRVGAVSFENDGTGADNPAFVANLNHFSVAPKGYTGNVGDAALRGGAAGVNLTQVANGQTTLCTAGSDGCGAPVWSAPNPDLNLLPFWPVENKVVSFGDKPGVDFDLGKTLPLASGGRLASIEPGVSTQPIKVSTNGGRNGVAMLEAEVSISVMDLSVNPADPLS
ncbi:MAG: hypothetical protein Q7T55_24195 [Solirubrobacteraceae bacterium]|nr:hypothetical protein [Solirubrobacteraceae bacterium]